MLPWTFILSSTQFSTCDFSIKKIHSMFGNHSFNLAWPQNQKVAFFYEVISIVSLTNLYTFQWQYGVCECEIITWYVKDEMLAGITLYHPLVLHRPPLIFENWKKVFTVQKYTAPNFQNSKKKFFFSLRILIIQKYFVSCCFHFVYTLIMVLNLYRDIVW